MVAYLNFGVRRTHCSRLSVIPLLHTSSGEVFQFNCCTETIEIMLELTKEWDGRFQGINYLVFTDI